MAGIGMVWMRNEARDDDALMFPLPDHKHLPLSSIAARWKLDPASLRVGQLALVQDANGSSISSIDEIRAYSSNAGFGDGLTEQNPLVISGEPGEPDIPLAPRWNSLTEKVTEAAAEPEEFHKLPGLEQQVLLPLRKLLRAERLESMMQELLFNDSGLYHYTTLLRTHEAREKEVATLVGNVYVNGRPTGMVSLVHPRGVCVTAWDCLKGFTEGKSKLQVKFPRFTGDVLYECRIKKRILLVVHLETVETQSFKRCMAVRDTLHGSFVFDGAESMKLVSCIELETEVDFLLPISEVKGRSMIGGPVVNHLGELKGVVIDASNFLKKPGSHSRRKCKSKGGEDLQIQSVLDLEEEKNRAKNLRSAFRDDIFHTLVECFGAAETDRVHA